MKITITKKDIDMLTLPDAGWYKASLVSVEDQPSKKDKTLITSKLTLNLMEDQNGTACDRDILHWISENGIGFNLFIIEAFLGHNVQEGEEFELDDFINSEIYVKLVHEPSNLDAKRIVAVIEEASPIEEMPF